MYHITDSQNIKKIKKFGLDPEFSKTGDGIYYSQDESHASAYEDHHGDWHSGTLLRIKLLKFDNKLLGADDADYPDIVGEDYDESDWKDSLQKSGKCIYSGIIKSKDIEFLSENGKWKKLIIEKEKTFKPSI